MFRFTNCSDATRESFSRDREDLERDLESKGYAKLSSVSAGLAVTLLAVFLLSSVEKIAALLSGRAAWHPVILGTPWLRARAVGAMAASLAADILAVCLLAFQSSLGVRFSLALLLVYTIFGARISEAAVSKEGCRCLWGILEANSRSGFFVRNLGLMAIAAVSLVVKLDPRPGVRSLSAGAVLLSLVALGIFVADWLARSRASPRPRNEDATSDGSLTMIGRSKR
jgi:hypothetical protein